ncbi:I78 family peptidase inhibitor [Pseudoxanthomonas sp. SGT-18]|uniref:I78 family peptidase inhibitor n=1 Tax=Pseudoxanthomonas sp. SGT-18 TaxID=2493087 RepID=UPI000F629F88|nr:I78 family peptidase inhibitor [Pseudoxanthomonas sp. SGT-18]
MRFRPRLVLPLVLLGLAACAGNNGTLSDDEEQQQALLAARKALESAADTGPTATEPPPPPSCDAAPVQGLVGETASDELVEQARTDAGADSVRVLKPGQAVTLEFNGARLNVEVDEANQIVSLRCG